LDHRQVGRYARSVNEVAIELGCDWHTVNDTVIAYGTALVDDDPERFGTVAALGLDEVLMVRVGPWHRQEFSTQIVDVGRGQLLDVVPPQQCWAHGLAGRTGEGMAGPGSFATLDLSGPYRRVFTLMLPDAIQVADPFHLIKLANSKLDECRRRCRTRPRTSWPQVGPPLPLPAPSDQGGGAAGRPWTGEARRPVACR